MIPPVLNSEDALTGTCGCGRSPTGDCCGWHSLSEDEYRVRLAEYDAQNLKIQQEINETETDSE